jgi:GNAT superfamily N-acetyltransferase
MGHRYFKRFRMEIDLARLYQTVPELPHGYVWSAWEPHLAVRHAQAKFASFHREIDALVFPCLGNISGCRRLMREIARRETFLPEATWLITHQFENGTEACDCGTIQGLAQQGRVGSIQNVGIAPEHGGFGLGRALVLKALTGFRDARMRRVFLEVTADNVPAVELYRSIGFRLTRTLYKAVDVQPSSVS